VLSERPTLIQIAGAVVVCTGVLAISLTTSQRRPRAPEAEAPALPRHPVAAADRG
jgi:hypothetical protein